MTEPLRIRPASTADAATCAAIFSDWVEATDWMPQVHSRESVIGHYQNHVQAKEDLRVIGDPVVGFIALDPDHTVVKGLYLAQTGLGLGKQLLDDAKTRAARLELWTFQSNLRAQRFYAREGFEEVRRTDGDNEEGLPDILLRWRR